jgi:hypothetical protein
LTDQDLIREEISRTEAKEDLQDTAQDHRAGLEVERVAKAEKALAAVLEVERAEETARVVKVQAAALEATAEDEDQAAQDLEAEMEDKSSIYPEFFTCFIF